MRRPGSRWRVQGGGSNREPQVSHAYDGITFDELVVHLADKHALHIEQMDTRAWWIGIDVTGRDGKPTTVHLWLSVARGKVRLRVTSGLEHVR